MPKIGLPRCYLGSIPILPKNIGVGMIMSLLQGVDGSKKPQNTLLDIIYECSKGQNLSNVAFWLANCNVENKQMLIGVCHLMAVLGYIYSAN